MKIRPSVIPILGDTFNQLENTFIVIDEKQIVIYINEYAQKLLGIRKNTSATGHYFGEIIKNGKYSIQLNTNIPSISTTPIQMQEKYKQLKIVPGTIDKKPVYFILDRDVTEQHKLYSSLENTLQEFTGQAQWKGFSLQQYVEEINSIMANILNKIPCIVYWKNKKFEYLGCNQTAANFAGLKSTKDIVGKTDFDLFPDVSLANSYRAMDKKVISEGKSIINVQQELVNSKGEKSYTLVSKTPLTNNDDQIIGVIGITVDITKEKQSEMAKTEFIANMSHDIRTPLSGVVGLGGMAEREIIDPDTKSKVHDMVQSADELLNMLNEILDVVSQDNISVKNIHEEAFDLSYLTNAIVDLEKASVDLKEIKLTQSIDNKIPPILFGDHKKIHHILLNLVGNAIKFTEKGHVNINIELSKMLEDKALLLFEVIDTGSGIPKESLNQVFELFYKITPSYKGLGKGHGIGLHIVKTYVESLGGKIHVESQENQGSKFSFSLMLKIADKDAKPQNITHEQLIERSEEPPLFSPSPEDKELTPTSIPNAPEILIIEDNDIARRVATSLIKETKCNPTAAADGESGLKLAKTKNFNLIITDIGLPGISGIEFVEQFRAHEKKSSNKPVPIVALTGHAEGKIRDECIAAGINEVIIKPIRPEILEKIVTKFSLFNSNKS